jgi:hypothetical protein
MSQTTVRHGSDGTLIALSDLFDREYGTVVGTTNVRLATGWRPVVVGPGMITTPVGPSNYLNPRIQAELVSFVGVASTSGGGIKTWQPASGLACCITRCLVNITTISTGAANLSVGQGSSATTSYTNLITASDVHSATILLDSLTLQAAATSPLSLLMAAGNFVTFTGSATTVGMVGEAIIEYWLT